jgi:type III restriction enzyme
MSDFSLMDAIECGIVKLPRVPVSDNIPEAKTPIFRDLWTHIGTRMPKKGRGKGGQLDPLTIPVELQTALEALYGHYEKVFDKWLEVLGPDEPPPCFIVVCNNTATSELVYQYISGFHRENADGSTTLENGRLRLFRNFDEHGNPIAVPRTLLIDSVQLEPGDALDPNFRKMASEEIEQFRRERVARTGQQERAEDLTDQELLREVMNTVGKKDRLGGQVRCVVSVSMLTEGWDANTVTHILGVRAFPAQSLPSPETAISRALACGPARAVSERLMWHAWRIPCAWRTSRKRAIGVTLDNSAFHRAHRLRRTCTQPLSGFGSSGYLDGVSALASQRDG